MPRDIQTLIFEVAAIKGLRQSTVYSYQGFFKRLRIADDSLTQEEIESRLLEIDNINVRRAAAMAVRSVLGHRVHVPAARPKRYPDLPDEDTLRLALMQTKYETRGLLMAFAGLRLGEACAVTRGQLEGDRLTVDRQMLELHATPDRPRVLRLAPTKSREGVVILPSFLPPLVEALTGQDTPGAVREGLKRAGQKVGIHLTPHTCRHWYATESLKRGMAIATVSKQLRHSRVDITMNTYAQPNDQEVRDIWN